MEERSLELRGIGKSFPGVRALDEISFKAEGGKVLALLGENGAGNRAAICEGLEYLGVKICPRCNAERADEHQISTADSPVKVFVIATNEELMIARDTKEIVSK